MNNPLQQPYREGLINSLFSTKRDYKQLYRLLLLTAGSLYLFFGLINLYFKTEPVHFCIQRLVAGSLWLTLAALSFISNMGRKYLQLFVYISAWLIMLHLLYIAIAKEFVLTSIMALILTFFMASTAFKKAKHLNPFVITNLILISLAIVLTVDQAKDKLLLMSSVVLTGLFTLIVLDLRLNIHDKLRISEHLFKDFFDNSADAIFIVEPRQLTIIDCNETACKLFGFDHKVELLNTSAFVFQKQTFSPEDLQYIQQTLADDHVWKQSMMFITAANTVFWGDLAIRGITIDKQSHFLYRISDITRQRQEQEQMRLLESVAVNVKDAVMITEAQPLDEPGPKITYVNRAFTEMTGYTYEESIGRSPRFLQGPLSNRDELNRIKMALLSRTPCEAELLNYKKDGNPFWVNFSIAPVMDQEGNVTHFVSVQRETTERKITLEQLAKSELRYRTLIEHSSNIIFSLSLEGDFTYVSTNWTGILGHEVHEVEGKNLADFIHEDDLKICIYYLKEVLYAEANGNWVEYRIKHKDGTWRWHTSSVMLVRNSKGKPAYFVGVCHDLSARKKEEDLVKASLHEKEVLLKEIHHRVKNNMSVISSLLSMQSNYIKDEEAKLLFKESQNRIRSMALIHDKLYQHESLANIEFGNYINDLVRDIKRSYNYQPAIINIDLQVDTVFMEVGKAIPCGLIINEIFSNAYKHAFKGRETGTIQICFTKTVDQYTLVVRDNGIGLPANMNINDVPSLGMQLITALVDQLHGSLEVTQDNGTTFTVSFRE